MAFEKSKQPVSKVYSHRYSTSSEQLLGIGNSDIETRGSLTVTCCDFKPLVYNMVLFGLWTSVSQILVILT